MCCPAVRACRFLAKVERTFLLAGHHTPSSRRPCCSPRCVSLARRLVRICGAECQLESARRRRQLSAVRRWASVAFGSRIRARSRSVSCIRPASSTRASVHPATILRPLPRLARAGAAGADAGVGQGDRHRGDHRHHHPADRHRQEERDHDGSTSPRAERNEGKPPHEAIYQACLLRPSILMTSMAALLGAPAADARWRRGYRAAPAAGHHHGRRPAAEHVLTPFTTPPGDLSLLRPLGPPLAAGESRRAGPEHRGRVRRGRRAMSPSTPFRRPVATTLLTPALLLVITRRSACRRWRRCPTSTSGIWSAPACRPPVHGLVGGHAGSRWRRIADQRMTSRVCWPPTTVVLVFDRRR